MKTSLKNPLGFLISIIVPQLILAFVFHSLYNIMETELTEVQYKAWQKFGIIWAILLGITTIFSISAKKIKISEVLLPFVVIIGYTYFSFYSLSGNLFNGMPSYLGTEDSFFMIFLYLTIPGILHAIIYLATTTFEPSGKTKTIVLNFLGVVLIPSLLYLFVTVIIPALNFENNYKQRDYFYEIAFIFSSVLFVFFLLRAFYGIFKNRKYSNTVKIIILVLVAIILPITGLLVNNYNFSFGTNSNGIFGNFHHPIFYITVIINALGLLLWFTKDNRLKLLAFFLQCFGFSYVLYFFLIFVPFLPLAIVAIIVIGSGFLTLTPILLFFLQLNYMSETFRFLKDKYAPKKLLLIGCLSFLMLPLGMHISFSLEKQNLEKALKYSYSHSLSGEETKLDLTKFKKTLEYIASWRNRRNGNSISGTDLPLISNYYNWLVLDNLTLSNNKVKDLNTLFYGTGEEVISPWGWRVPPNQLNDSIGYSTHTTFNKEGGFYKTELHLNITNLDSIDQLEFRSSFSLPAGVYINDYYLDIEEERVHGILAEKKAAEWIYNEVTSQRRDPGILKYEDDKRLSLKIFPFGANQTRTTGITFIHRSPFSFKINDTLIEISSGDSIQTPIQLNANSYFISSEAKSKLPKATSLPKYYFVVDNTTGSDSIKTTFRHDQKKIFNNISHQKEILYVDYQTHWNKSSELQPTGVFLEKALTEIAFKHQQLDTYPVVVIYAERQKCFLGDFNANNYGDVFTFNNIMYADEFIKKTPSFLPITTKKFNLNGIAYHLKDNQKPSIVSDDNLNISTVFQKEHSLWTNAVLLKNYESKRFFYPEKNDKSWLAAVKASFKSRILCNSTSFISLENEMQRKAMLKKQEDILNGNYALEASTEPRRMSEPYFWILFAIGILFIAKSEWKRRQLFKASKLPHYPSK